MGLKYSQNAEVNENARNKGLYEKKQLTKLEEQGRPRAVLKELNNNLKKQPSITQCKTTQKVIDDEDFTQYTEYADDVHRYMLSLEKIYTIQNNFMANQKDINSRMRSVVVDWLVQVQNKFKMTPETLQLTVRIIDSYLSQRALKRDKLQLLGIAAMLIASKYEEMMYPEIGNFTFITNEAYDAEQLLAMEFQILVMLDFSISFPLPINFLRRFTKMTAATPKIHRMAKYFVELTLLDERFSARLPSLVAAGSLYLSGLLLADGVNNNNKWSGLSLVERHSNYPKAVLVEVARDIARLVRTVTGSNSQTKSTFKKYSDKHNDCISLHSAFSSRKFMALI